MEPSALTRAPSLTSRHVDCSGEEASVEVRRCLDRARRLFAEVVERDERVAALGSIVLRPDQMDTARRVRAHLRRDGGCLLADDVGSGKTYVALAVARDWARTLVLAPASLRATWTQAAQRARVGITVVSHESLSRGRLPDEPYDGIIVDESHRFRDTSRRHDTLARLASFAPLVLLSATPMQNRSRELAAQVALFLGEAAYRIEPEALARWVVRSVSPPDAGLPLVAPPRWIPLDADDGAVLRAILALPPPPRAVDAGDGGVLLQLSLVRAWASSRAALVAGIRRRQCTLTAIEQCHAEGRVPTRRELRSWQGGGDVQLGFATLLAGTVVAAETAATLSAVMDGERAALDALMRTLARGADPDSVRVSALRALRAAYPGTSILAFSEWASTVRAYWAGLRTDAGVGLLTAREGRIASGRISRDALLARFAPRAQGAPDPPARERVTLLLTTDLLSEGVNLQDASVVVHLDLPWNPARLAQRLGRIRRPGGARRVASYLMSPPARASILLRAEARLRTKLRRAERTIGRGLAVMPALAAAGVGEHGHGPVGDPAGERAPSLSAAELRGEIVRRLVTWRREVSDALRTCDDGIAIAAARAEERGWIALLDDGRLIASTAETDGNAHPSDLPDAIVRALVFASGTARRVSNREREGALAALEAWLARDWMQRSCGLAMDHCPLRRRVLRALDAASRAAPRHRRAMVLERVAKLRRSLTLPLPLGLERALDALASGSPATHAWIDEAASLVARAPARSSESGVSRRTEPRALIVFG